MKHILLLVGAAALASTAPALAKPGKGKGHHGNHHAQGIDGPIGYGVGGCPPGLAKKAPKCVPPGQHKKLFALGQQVPSGYNGFTPYGALPYDLRNQYGLSDDYRYIYRDNQLYQVDPTTYVVRRILDSIL